MYEYRSLWNDMRSCIYAQSGYKCVSICLKSSVLKRKINEVWTRQILKRSVKQKRRNIWTGAAAGLCRAVSFVKLNKSRFMTTEAPLHTVAGYSAEIQTRLRMYQTLNVQRNQNSKKILIFHVKKKLCRIYLTRLPDYS